MLSAFFVAFPSERTHGFHPIHVSVTEIEYDAAEKELEIMMRIFIDDLENALRRFHGLERIDVLNPTEVPIEKLISAYLIDKFIVSIDSRQRQFRYLGQEEEGQAFICYIQVPGVNQWRECEVTNSILLEMFDDQSNIVHVTSDGVTRSQRLTRSNPKGRFSF